MSKHSTKIKRGARALPAPKPEIEALPERLKHAGGHSLLVPATIEKAGDKAVLCRRFKDGFADRQRGNGRFTYAQWFAAEWYRETFEQAGATARVVANYSPTGGGSSTGLRYGTPANERQARARQAWRKARKVIPPQMLAIVDRVILEDAVPVFRNGQQRARFTAKIATALQPLAEWLMPTCAQSVSSVDLATVD